ncbi:MAG: peptidoglycan DD-metalloendopeptidase family protein [Pseudooceanicola sp.]
MSNFFRNAARGLAASALALAAGCSQPLDWDMRGHFNQFSTAEAARLATTDRPRPDARGIISYPNYQVAVARDGDTVARVAERIGMDPATLASHNGLKVDDRLRRDEVLALPARVAEPSAATGAPGTDIAALAGGAIDRAGDRSVATTTLDPATPAAAPAPQPGPEPTRHKVTRGETAFTVARLYNVSVRALAEWNGLDSDYTIREGQYLLIPVAAARGTAPAARPSAATEPPGAGTPTPVPPSAAKPLPEEKTVPVAAAAAAPKPAAPDIGQAETPRSNAAMVFPVKGSIIREYSKGRNDGIDIQAAAGTEIRAADAGQVAAITADAEGNHVIVIRHEGKLLTIYSNVTGITVKEKQSVKRGETIAKIPTGNATFVHFEVRKGLESTDPLPYLQ